MLDLRTRLRAEHDRLRDRATHDLPLIRDLDNHDRQHAKAQRTLTALDIWADWANGHNVRPS